MASNIDQNRLTELETLDSQARYDYLLEKLIENQEIWMLSDKEGLVLLNSDGIDCLPVWPHKECAEAWISGDWKKCEAKAIELDVWQSRWTAGLLEDGFSVAAFPNQQQEAIVLPADEFDDGLLDAMSAE